MANLDLSRRLLVWSFALPWRPGNAATDFLRPRLEAGEAKTGSRPATNRLAASLRRARARARLPIMTQFDHERLDVYRVAIDFIVLANDVAQRLPRGRAYVADQLQRAGTSISLNIAEGAGEFSSKEKARFYRMARRSATECAAILDVCSKLELAERDAVNTGRELLLRIIAMLTQDRPASRGGGHGHGLGHQSESE